MSQPRKPSQAALWLAFATIYLIWGSTYLGIRVAVASMPPFAMVGYRFLIAGLFLFAVLKFRGAAWPTKRQWLDNALSGSVLFLGGTGLVAWAEQKVPSGLTTLIVGASPFFMVFLDWLRPGGARPTPGVWIGIVVGISGIFTLLGPGAFSQTERPSTLSVVALFVSAMCWCIGTLYSKHTKNNAPPIMSAAMQMITGSLVILLAATLGGETSHFAWSSVSRPSLVAFGYLIVAGSLIAYPVYVWLLNNTTAARLSTYAYVNPVVAVFLGWAILGEPLTLRIVIAGAIIILAVAIITIQRTRKTA